VNHVRTFAKGASREGHRLSALTVSYPGGRTRQLSLRSEMVPLVRRGLANYPRLKAAIEAICEINQDLLRQNHPEIKIPATDVSSPRGCKQFQHIVWTGGSAPVNHNEANFRVEVHRYESETPSAPMSPLSAISETQLLTHGRELVSGIRNET
jgi:hypothetical protein